MELPRFLRRHTGPLDIAVVGEQQCGRSTLVRAITGQAAGGLHVQVEKSRWHELKGIPAWKKGCIRKLSDRLRKLETHLRKDVDLVVVAVNLGSRVTSRDPEFSEDSLTT